MMITPTGRGRKARHGVTELDPASLGAARHLSPSLVVLLGADKEE